MKNLSYYLIIILPLLFLIQATGCEKKSSFEIFENHDITACGVKDPLVNLPWLKAFYNNYLDNPSQVDILIYKNKSTGLSHIVIIDYRLSNPDVTPTSVYKGHVYSCDGKELMAYITEGPGFTEWEKFHTENDLTATIFSIKYQN